MSNDNIQTLKKKITDLEKKVGREDRVCVLEIKKEDVINAQMKSYENNIKIVGWEYDMKEAQKKDRSRKGNGGSR
jgi:phosphotransferase system IIB component